MDTFFGYYSDHCNWQSDSKFNKQKFKGPGLYNIYAAEDQQILVNVSYTEQ